MSISWLKKFKIEALRSTLCSFLVREYLSNFIENKVIESELSLGLSNGRATAEKIFLAVEALNKLSETQNWPVQVVEGYIDKIHISIPWTAIFSESTQVEICGLRIKVQPKQRIDDATSMLESMWNSMSSSMKMAEEFAKEAATKQELPIPAVEGLNFFAQAIETIMKRIKVKFVDTVIEVEHLPLDSQKGVGLVINIDSVEFFDDFTMETENKEACDPPKKGDAKNYLIDAVTTKNIVLKGIRLSSIEFSSDERNESTITQDSFETAQDSDSVSEDDNESDDGPVVLCGKLFDNQELKLRLKQSDQSSGPKVAIELNLGALVLFLSPRQFHMLKELAEGFLSPNSKDTSNALRKNQPEPRPMTEMDYERIEEQLAQMTSHRHMHGFNILQGHGWSTGPLDESTGSEYLPMQAETSEIYDSTMSGLSSSLDFSITSSMTSAVTDATSHARQRACNINSDPTAEISNFQIRLSSLAVILLHEDQLAHSAGNGKVIVGQMQSLANQFFGSLTSDMFSELAADGFDELHKRLQNSCNLSQIRLLASPVKFEGNETTISSAFSISGNLTASKLEISEWLYNGQFQHIPLVSFKSPQALNSPSGVKPNFSLKFKHVQRQGRSGDYRKKNGPKTDISILLDQCIVEFDLSIIDRISSVLNHPPICERFENDRTVPSAYQTHAAPYLTADTVSSIQDIKLSCPSINLKIRFPIPDYRPATDMSKPPWWERNVRPDYLSLILQRANFHTVFQTQQNFSEFNIDCKLLDIVYYETENATGQHIARSGREEKPYSAMNNTPLTKLSIKVYPKQLENDADDRAPDIMTQSFYGPSKVADPGPFGGKLVVHESDTPHDNFIKDESEEQVIPGDKLELQEFMDSTRSNGHIIVDLILPTVSIELESKHTYELIYNRINNDLLLWEPQAPKPTNKNPLSAKFHDLSLNNEYIVANSGLQSDSDSDSGEYEEVVTNIFYSAYGGKSKVSPVDDVRSPIRNSQSNFILSLNIQEGMLNVNPPCRDGTNNVIPGQQGELLLNLDNAKVFIVSGYKGEEDLAYVCVQMKSVELYHCDNKPAQRIRLPLREPGAILGKELFPTIYQSDKKSMSLSKHRGKDREMFTVAVKVEANHETHHVKVVTVSLGLNGATLRHKMGKQPNSWISHLMDYFNVEDYPIPGYVPKDVLTELHLHIWDSIIDYRPLYLPLRSAIGIGSFSISSHLSAVANTSTLTMMFEDCGFFLSDKHPPKDGVCSTVKVDLERDYVNVIEIALFEISIKTTDKQSGINPHIDLRTSITNLSVRTCSDSGRALFQLLTYYINDGDFPVDPQLADSINSNVNSNMEEELIRLKEQENSLSKSQEEQISEMLKEAMEDDTVSKTPNAYPQTGAQLFYFPDEKEGQRDVPSFKNPVVVTDLGVIERWDVGGNRLSFSDDDFDFVYLQDDSIPPKDGVPEITWLSQNVQILEDYFAKPDGKRDVLAPPKSFPTPVAKYTLCDMSITWKMYGGHDFKTKDDPKREVRFTEVQLHDKVSFSHAHRATVTLSPAQNERTKGLSWIQRGGANRNHSVLMELQLNKVRFSHEVYPDSVQQVSRQVLCITDIEIKDQLASSQINKFLYQYSSHSHPKQSNSHMVLIKTLHSRPDRKIKRQECDIKISLLPIRLNIDQDSLFFLINFFKELSGENADENVTEAKTGSLHSTPTHQPPILTTSLISEREIEQKAKEVVNENLILLESRYHTEPEAPTEDANTFTVADDSPIYFRYLEFSKDVLIRLDYVGKGLDMSRGSIAGILMGLGHLNCSEIRLKRIVYRHGLLGVTKLIEFLLREWIGDIKKNQLSAIFKGVGPVKAVLQLFQGIKDLFWLPIEQYQKDGRIVRGLQRGANSFTTSTVMAALELTTRLIYLIQVTAETAYDMLSPGPSVRMKRLAKRKGRRKRYHQPQDIREGLANACTEVREGIGETANNILQVVASEKDQKGISGAVGAVFRQIPPTMLIKPCIIATGATNNLLMGVQNQLMPDTKREANQKWKADS
ncbi:hypothetical protein HUJ04_004965 [Dendroctonus ponderosae]|uniref:Autophagy-related protein 2 n=1 Tax=Dendroctonus ponderosae TaxID=77166 RepID=A0AAR5QCL4_DENPD|nr:hypothetical protein HUJ04_004965 [Dendroctonus ponderosae]